MNQPDEIYELDEACSRFESEWSRLDGPPDLKAFLADAGEQNRGDLFPLLLPIDVEHRRRRSLAVDASTYRQQFPEFQAAIDAEFASPDTVSVNQDSSMSGSDDFSADMPETVESLRMQTSTASHVLERRQIGRYAVLSPLGGGGQANVFRASHPTLPIEVAIKVGHKQLSESSRQDMLDEAQVLCDLDHPGIAKIRDLDFDESGYPILVLELVRGRSLAQVLSEGKVSEDRIVKWLAAAADAVDYAHRRGVLHLDLKPGNIVIAENDEAKVIDFGLARSRDVWSDVANEDDRIAGTPEYMAPEQARGIAEKITARADIFGLGAILYRVLIGAAPFHAAKAERALLRSRNYDFDVESLEKCSASENLKTACQRALAEDPTDRFADAREFASALRAAIKPDVNDEDTETPAPRKLASVVMAIGATVLILLFASTAVIALRDNNEDTTEIANDAGNLLLQGDIRVTVIRDGKQIPIERSDARPLRSDDAIQIQVDLERPGYPYIVWVDESGTANPVYPGKPGDWSSWSTTPDPVSHLNLPNRSEGWRMQGEKGMQTFVMLARREPLGSDIDAQQLFDGLPRQTIQDNRALVYFDDGLVSGRADRAPDFFELQKVRDPVLQTQDILSERMRPHFPLIRAVSVAFAPE